MRKITKEGRIRLISKMREEALRSLCEGRDVTLHDIYRVSTTWPVEEMLKDIPKLRYFFNNGKWFENTQQMVIGLSDLYDMYTGWYSPTLKERIINIKNLILSYVYKF